MNNYMVNTVMMAYAQTSSESHVEEDTDENGLKIGALPFWGNVQTMNLNPLILTNVVGSPYYKTNLVGMKCFEEVVDEIYYKVNHLEPWERGSRKLSGQTGMCGGVRGVGAGGIVSSAYCLLFKLYNLKITEKQLNTLLSHCDSPYIRGLGLMFIRYTQPPTDMWSWFEYYLEDTEEIDIKAGGGRPMTIGELCKQMLTKMEWFDTRFPRIPVNVQKQINQNLEDYYSDQSYNNVNSNWNEDEVLQNEETRPIERPRQSHPNTKSSHSEKRSRSNRNSYSRERKRSRERRHKRSRSPKNRHHHHHHHHYKHKKEKRSRTPDFEDSLKSYTNHRRKKSDRSRSRSRGRK